MIAAGALLPLAQAARAGRAMRREPRGRSGMTDLPSRVTGWLFYGKTGKGPGLRSPAGGPANDPAAGFRRGTGDGTGLLIPDMASDFIPVLKRKIPGQQLDIRINLG